MKQYAGILIIASLLIAAGLSLVFLAPHSSTTPSLASVSSAPAPWPAETDHLKERLAALGLPALSQEGSVIHIHQHLDIFVHGKPVAVPADIGIHTAPPQFIAPIHTHDSTGIVHVEAPTQGPFTLGQFFSIWGVRLTPVCIGGYCADERDSLAVYVNGQRYQGDPSQLVLAAHQEIAIVYGTATETPSSIPASYTFPEGY